MLNLSCFWPFDRADFCDGKNIGIGTRIVVYFVVRLRLSRELCRDIICIFDEVYVSQNTLKFQIIQIVQGLWAAHYRLATLATDPIRAWNSDESLRIRSNYIWLYPGRTAVQKHSWNESRFSKRILKPTGIRSFQCVFHISIKLTFSPGWTFQLFIFSPKIKFLFSKRDEIWSL